MSHKNSARLLTDNGKTIVEIHLCEGKDAKIEKPMLFEDGIVRDLNDEKFQYDAVKIVLEDDVEMLTVEHVDSYRNHPNATLTIAADRERPLGVVLKASRFVSADITQPVKYLKFSLFSTDSISIVGLPPESPANISGLKGLGENMGLSGLKMNGLFGATTLLGAAEIVYAGEALDKATLHKRNKEWRETNASNNFKLKNKTELL